MKLRVRGYDEHRLKDPYKFWAKLLDTPPRRKRKGVAHYTYVSRLDETTLRFTEGSPSEEVDDHKLLCTLTDYNVWTIHVDPKHLFPGEGNRIRALVGVWPQWNKKNYAMYENPCRLYFGNWSSVPYEKGVKVHRGQVVERQKYIDRKRVINEQDANPIRKKLKKIYELAPVMIRLLEANGDRQPTRYWERHKIMDDLVRGFDPDNVNGLDAERVYLIGEGSTSRRRTFTNKWDARTGAPIYVEEPIEQYRRRCVVSGLRKLREHVYSKEGVYQYEPVK